MMPFSASVTPGIVFGLAAYMVMQMLSPADLYASLSSSPAAKAMAVAASPKEQSCEYQKMLLSSNPNSVHSVHSASDGEASAGRSVAVITRKESGHWDIVEAQVPRAASSQSNMEVLCRMTPAPSPVPEQDSVVPAACIGMPR